MTSLTTAGVPSASATGATSASVAVSYGSPTVIRPIGFEAGNQRGQLRQPVVGAGDLRLVADNQRDFDVSDPGSRAGALP